jgi:hypothetical protein
MIGLGLMRKDWSKMRRPNTYLKIGPRMVLKVSRISNDFTKAEWIAQTFYAHILGHLLSDWLGKDVIPAYTRDDWVAYANFLIVAFAGTGSTDKTQQWQATDVETSVNMMPGYGWSEANRFLWGEVKTKSDFTKYYTLMNILGLVVNRVKGAQEDFNLKTVMSSNDWQIPTRLKRALVPNIENWGSTGTFYFLMPRNNFAYGDEVDIPFPCIVDEVVLHDKELLTKSNTLEDILPYKQQTFKDVTIDRGEVPQGAINTTTMDSQFIRLHATTDARIITFQDTNTQYVRRLIQYRFPMRHIVKGGLKRTERVRLWLWGLLANGEKGMKNAYIIESSLGVFNPMIVNYRRGPLDSQIVDKKDTNTTGDQIIKPGTIPTSQTSEQQMGKTIIKDSVTPPAPDVKQPMTQKTVELANGDEVKEFDVADSSNENAESTNNKPEET